MSGEEIATYSPPGVPAQPGGAVWKWSGRVDASAGPVEAYLGDGGLTADGSTKSVGTPIPMDRTFLHYQVNVIANTMSIDTTVALALDGADTALSVVVPAGATGRFEVFDQKVSAKDGQALDLRVAGDGGIITLSASVIG